MTLETVGKYRIWRAQNRHAIRVITYRALSKQSAGRGRGSAWENADLRFDHTFRIVTQDEFKICNDYWALMSRDIVRANPGLQHFFEFRPLKGFTEMQIDHLLTASPDKFPGEDSQQGSLF